MSHSTSCVRYVGPHEACPYCGARQYGHTAVRTVKVAAIVLATVGLALLWVAGTCARVPLIQIGQAGATMNMAYVLAMRRYTEPANYLLIRVGNYRSTCEWVEVYNLIALTVTLTGSKWGTRRPPVHTRGCTSSRPARSRRARWS
jgi:hypothetical protein